MPLSEIQRRIRKSKQTERNLGHWLQKHDAEDPRWTGIASSAARVGHVTGLQFDVVSKSYAAECKNVKLPATIMKWWIQINQVATTHGKDALLYIEPTNEILTMGVRKKVPTLHIITEERHAELLRKEKLADSIDL